MFGIPGTLDAKQLKELVSRAFDEIQSENLDADELGQANGVSCGKFIPLSNWKYQCVTTFGFVGLLLLQVPTDYMR